MSIEQLDGELESILGRLNAVQEAVGGKKEKVNEDILGADGKVDRFMELKNQMTQRLNTIKGLTAQVATSEKTGGNPKEVVAMGAQLRENLKQLGQEMRDLDAIYNKEASKRKSKFSPDELELRRNMRDALAAEVEAMRDQQKGKYAPGFQGRKLASLEDSELITGANNPVHENGKAGPRVSTQRNMEMTDVQRQQLQQIKERDQQFNTMLDDVSKGLDTLKDIAVAQNEEVKRQNIMLEGLATNIDRVHEKVSNVNASLKEKLEELGGADKMCMNMICLVLLLGMIGIVYKLTSG